MVCDFALLRTCGEAQLKFSWCVSFATAVVVVSGAEVVHRFCDSLKKKGQRTPFLKRPVEEEVSEEAEEVGAEAPEDAECAAECDVLAGLISCARGYPGRGTARGGQGSPGG